MAEQYSRYESFLERYVLERASSFRQGLEREEAYQAGMDGRTAYEMIQAENSRRARRDAADVNGPANAQTPPAQSLGPGAIVGGGAPAGGNGTRALNVTVGTSIPSPPPLFTD